MTHTSKVNRNRWFYNLQLIVDIIIVATSYLAGFYFQRPKLFQDGIPSEIIIVLVYVSIITIVFFSLFKINECGKVSLTKVLFNLFLALICVALSTILVDFIVKGIGIWRKTIFYEFCLAVPVFILYKAIIYYLHKKIIPSKNSVVIGKTLEDAALIALKIIVKNSQLHSIKNISHESSNANMQYIKNSQQVFLSSACSAEAKTNIIEQCVVSDIDCAIIPNFEEIVINSGTFDNIGDMMIFNMDVGMDVEISFIKRVIDIVVSFLVLLITSPIIFLSMLVITLQDGENPIYSQTRLTKKNHEFTIYKLRTMIINAEEKTGAVLASANDIRITKFGKFIRSTRIDELPQLFNVLKGDMSLVGPRPERPDLVAKIVNDVPEFKYRTLVNAGVTGLAQTLGRYDTSFQDKLLFDLYYANNYSLLLDFKIMFYTINTLFTPSASAGVSSSGGMTNLDILQDLNPEIKICDDQIA